MSRAASQKAQERAWAPFPMGGHSSGRRTGRYEAAPGSPPLASPLTCGLGHGLEQDTVPNAQLQALLRRAQAVEAEVEDGQEVGRRQGHHGAEQVTQCLYHAEPGEIWVAFQGLGEPSLVPTLVSATTTPPPNGDLGT